MSTSTPVKRSAYLNKSAESRVVALGACLVCGGSYGPSNLPGLLRCLQCDFVSADLDISDAALAGLYSKNYFHGEEYADYVVEEESLQLNFRDRIKALRQFVPGITSADLFEIGCAYGFFLKEVQSVVRSAEGVDISTDAVKYAVESGVNARQGDYLAIDLGRSVDIIAMWDTIEHLKRPDLFVLKASRDLRPGGVIAITTGDIGSLNARLRGRRWRMIHPPTHLHYFSVATLCRLLDRHGFEVVSVSHPGNARTIRAIAYIILVLHAKKQSLYDKIGRLAQLDRRLTVNLYDIMYVIARRR